MNRLSKGLLLMCGVGLLVPVCLLAQGDDELDFTKGDLASEALTIKAEADKPQVQIIPSRIPPVFKKYQLDERSFVDEILNSATHQQLNKKFKKKTFKVEVPEIE